MESVKNLGSTRKSNYKLISRIIHISVLILISSYSYSATYYFSSSSGNDQNSISQAQSPNTPWKSIDKLNSIFLSLGAGDSVLFKRGDVFAGQINVTKSGAPFAPISFGAYGVGNMPQINGLAKLTSWTHVGNGIYESPCTSLGNNLIINGVQQTMGRYPNKGYLTFESHNNNTSITDNQLTSTTNWTGAEVVIRKDRWTLDKSKITTHSGGTITYATGTSATPNNGYGYFIQKSSKTLDQVGEWFYDDARKVMMVVFGSKDPAACTVQTSAINTLVSIQNNNYLTFENLDFVGAGKNAFHIFNSKNITLNNCSINFTGDEAVLVGWSQYFTIQNSIINHSLSGGVNLDNGCAYASIVNNRIKNTGLFPGLGKSGSGTYEAITSFGDNAQIEKNKIDSTGYNGIYFGGNNSIVKNNFINYFCSVKDDGAGIYVGDWSKWYNKKIIDNIVLNGIGAGEGTNAPTSLMAEGIYIDDLSESVTISGNTVSLCANNGIKIHNAKDVYTFNNTAYNNNVQLRLEQDHYIPQSTYIRNNVIKNNIFFSKNSLQNTSLVSTHQDDITEFGVLDSNAYVRPLDVVEGISTMVVRNGSYINQAYDLSGWKSAYGKDYSSTTSPQTIPAYKVSKLIGLNKFSNGEFNTDISGMYWYSTVGDCAGSFTTGKLDGGSLKLSFNSTPGNRVIVNMRAGAITANKKYMLKFSLLGTVGEKSVQTYLRNTGSPYAEISDIKTSKISNTRTENEVLLTATANETDASIIFDMIQPTGQIYIDNVQLYEVETVNTNPDDYVLFEYNASDQSKTISLNRTYIDVHKNTYSGKVSIKPYSSVVLIASDSPVTKSSQTITFANLQSTVYNNTPTAINATASSGLPVSLTVVSGPGSLAGNVLSFKESGTVLIEATQAGNEEFASVSATTQIVNISKLTQTIVFAGLQALVYEGSPVALHTIASSGLPVTLKVVSGPGVLYGNVISFNDYGTVIVEATQAGTDKIAAVTTTVEITNSAKTSQTIVFTNTPGTVYDGTPVTLTATASSGLPVTLKVVSGPGSISGNVLSFNGTGVVTVQASQAGNEKVGAATATIQITNSSKESQTIVFANTPSTVYNSTPVTITATTSTGLPVTLKVVSGPGSISGNLLSFNGTGVVTVQASQAGNEKIEATTATIQITNSLKASQTIIFANAPSTVYNGTTVTLSATASSGLPVTLKVVSGPGVISGNLLSFNGTGIVTVQASQAGNEKIEAATATIQITNSSKASQTIVFASTSSAVYDNTPISITATASSGLPVTLKVVSGPGSISGNILSFNGTGVVTVQASQAGNEKIEAATATIQITNSSKASQTIIFANTPSTVYNGTPVTLSAIASSGLPVTLKVVSGPGSISGNVLSFSGTGVVTVQALQAGNEKIEAATASIQITNSSKASQTIVFDNIPSTVYNGTLVTLSATASSGLPVTLKVVSGPGIISGNILSFNGTGVVTVQALQAGNEKIEAATATIQITNSSKASQTIIFANTPSTVYNGTPVTLSATASSGLPVTLKVVSGPGSISGNVLSFSGTGVVTVQALQAGNEKIEAATASIQITNSSKASQTIVFASTPSTVTNSTPVTLTATASSGLPVTLKVVSGPGSISGNVLSFSGTGVVTVQASQAGNEKIEAATATIQITNSSKTAQTITFVNLQTSVSGGTPVAIHTFASSGLPVTLKVISGPGDITGNVLVFNGYGTIVIEATQAGSDKFERATLTAQIVNTPAESLDFAKLSPIVSELKAYPNPFTNKLSLEFTMPVSGYGTLILYNLQGKFIHQIYAGPITAYETKTYYFNADDLGLSEGIYLVRMAAGKEALYQKVILVK